MDNILTVNKEVLQDSQAEHNTSSRLAITLKFFNCFVLFYRILELIENVVDNIPITNASEPVVITQKFFSISLQLVEAFIQSDQVVTIDSIQFQHNISSEFSDNIPTTSVSFPSSLFSQLASNLTNTSRIANIFFLTDSLFVKSNSSNDLVSSIVISTSVFGVKSISELMNPINISFQINLVRVHINY